MAIYSLSLTNVCRAPKGDSSGRSACAAAAYRAGIAIEDERLGRTFDFSRKEGVVETGIVLPAGVDAAWLRADPDATARLVEAEAAGRLREGQADRIHVPFDAGTKVASNGDWLLASGLIVGEASGEAPPGGEAPGPSSGPSPEVRLDRSALWNAAEAAEARKDARVAHELRIALPHETTPEARREMVLAFSHSLADRYGVAVDYAVHAPSRDGDQRNHHVHLLLTTRAVTPDGLADRKARLSMCDKDRRKHGVELTQAQELKVLRAEWAAIANHALERHAIDERIDHRSNAERGLALEPGIHLGPNATAVERQERQAFEVGRTEERMEERMEELLEAMAPAGAAPAYSPVYSPGHASGSDLRIVREAEAIRERNMVRLENRPELALEVVTEGKAVFTERDVERVVERYATGFAGRDEERAERIVAAAMGCAEAVRLRPEGYTDDRVWRPALYTTGAQLRAEEDLRASVDRLLDRGRRDELELEPERDVEAIDESWWYADSSPDDDAGRTDRDERPFEASVPSHAVASEHVERAAKAQPFALSDEQRGALEALTGEGGIAVLSGVAGAGKSTVMGSVREAYEAEGYRVRGAALSAMAARGLEQSSGIEARTLASWERSFSLAGGMGGDPDAGVTADARVGTDPHGGDQRTMDPGADPSARLERDDAPLSFRGSQAQWDALSADRQARLLDERLGPRDVFVIDEAGMVGTRQLLAFVHEAESAGAKVVLVGDERQLQPIASGAGFRAVAERVEELGAERASLTDVRRQTEDWQREATIAFADGRAGEAIGAYREHGAFRAERTVGDAHAVLADRVLTEWDVALLEERAAPASIPASTIVMAHTKADVEAIGSLVREGLVERGEVAASGALFDTREGAREFAAGDVVMFRQNDGRLDVLNGTTGRVVEAETGRLTVAVPAAGPAAGSNDANGDGARAERLIEVSDRSYGAIQHGYAMTVHKAQGITVDRAFVYASPSMDAQLAYVAMSRHREDVEVVYSRDAFREAADRRGVPGVDGDELRRLSPEARADALLHATLSGERLEANALDYVVGGTIERVAGAEPMADVTPYAPPTVEPPALMNDANDERTHRLSGAPEHDRLVLIERELRATASRAEAWSAEIEARIGRGDAPSATLSETPSATTSSAKKEQNVEASPPNAPEPRLNAYGLALREVLEAVGEPGRLGRPALLVEKERVEAAWKGLVDVLERSAGPVTPGDVREAMRSDPSLALDAAREAARGASPGREADHEAGQEEGKQADAAGPRDPLATVVRFAERIEDVVDGRIDDQAERAQEARLLAEQRVEREREAERSRGRDAGYEMEM